MSGDYQQFLESKRIKSPAAGLDTGSVTICAFDFQRDIIRWALRRGRAAIWADCGLGKSLMQLEWARRVSREGKVLILAPLAVAEQTVAEAKKFNIDVAIEYRRDGVPVDRGVTITNYEMLEHFDPADFDGIVLDESSILKHYTSKTPSRLTVRPTCLTARLKLNPANANEPHLSSSTLQSQS